MKILLAVSLLVALPLAAFAQAPAAVPHPGTEKPASCGPSVGLHFVCGLEQPEDLIQIHGSKWLVASQMGEAGCLALVDNDAKTARRF